MANITASMVKELREMTGAGMMECKKALAEAEGDLEKAVDVLRTRGLAAVAKKAGRATNEGAVMAIVNDACTTGAVVELNCETDFVGMNEKFKAYAEKIAKAALAAKPALAALSTEEKKAVLLSMADALEANAPAILAANAQDLEQARGTVSDVMLDRLALSPERIRGMAQGIREVAALPDPVGEVLARVERPNGLVIEKTAVPMGVIAIIYESRPNVTSDAAALALKAGSACVLRCGKEAHRSAAAIVSALCRGLSRAGLPQEALCLVEDTTRASAHELMTASGYVDLLIPRGGAGLIRACVDNATVPVIETGTGICHVYVDRAADLDMALDILENAKCSRPSVCNAAEVCLVHRAIAKEFLHKFQKRMVEDRAAAGLHPVRLRLDGTAAAIIPGEQAGERDFDTEFLDYVMAVAVVDDVEDRKSVV